MSDTEKKVCKEYPTVKCELGLNYPYCDMTCPMNRYVEKSQYMNDHDQECVGMYWKMPTEEK